MGKASDLTNTDTSNYWLYPANSITLTCPESSFISNVPGQQRSATRSASIMQYLPLLSGGKPSDPATDGVPSPAAQWQCMGSRCACRWGGSQSEFRDCCSEHSVIVHLYWIPDISNMSRRSLRLWYNEVQLADDISPWLLVNFILLKVHSRRQLVSLLNIFNNTSPQMHESCVFTPKHPTG